MNQLWTDLNETERLLRVGFTTGDLCAFKTVFGNPNVPCYCLDGAIAEATGFPISANRDDIGAYRHLEQIPRAIACVKAVYEEAVRSDLIPNSAGFDEEGAAYARIDALWHLNDRLKSQTVIVMLVGRAKDAANG